MRMVQGKELKYLGEVGGDNVGLFKGVGRMMRGEVWESMLGY